MGVIERAREALRVFLAPTAETEKTASGGTQAWGTVFAAGFDSLIPFMGGAKLLQPYSQHPTIYAAVSAISQGISALPLEMFPDSDAKRESPIGDSIVKALLDVPGPDMDGPQLIEGTIGFMELYGEAFWFLDGLARRTGNGPQFPTSITLWDPKDVRAVVKAGRVAFWEFQTGADVLRVGADAVIQFKHFNPYDAIRGLAPMSAAMLPAQGGYKALAYQDAFFENSCILGGLVTAKEGAIIQPEAMIRLRDELEARHSGASRRGRLGVINAPVDYTEIGMSQKDMDFPTWLDASSAFILMVFKVPPSVAGLQKDANYSASVQQAKQFWFNHLPLAHYLERRIKQRLCKPFGIAETPYFKTESIKAMTEEQKAVSDIARNLWNMGVSFRDINERMELGFPADDTAADTRWVVSSMVNADLQATVDPAKATGSPAPAQPQNQPGDMPTQMEPDAGKGLSVGMNAQSREIARGMNWRTLISRVRDEEMAFERRVRDHFFSLKGEVLLKLRGRKEAKFTDINVEVLMFDEAKAEDDLKKRTTPLYKSALQKGAESVAAELGMTIDFNFLSPEVVKFLAEKMFEIADLIDGPLRDRLRASLQEGIDKGESIEKIADRVEEVFGVERSRARRIARTEVAEAFNGGRYATMKEAGVERLEWLSARDERVRDSHVEVDGEIVMLGDKFSNGLLYPTDKDGPAEEIVNCRCVFLAVA
jgi:HK97 family phage portal protein